MWLPQREVAASQKAVLASVWAVLDAGSPVLCCASQDLLVEAVDIVFAKGGPHPLLVPTVAALAKAACSKSRQPFSRV